DLLGSKQSNHRASIISPLTLAWHRLRHTMLDPEDVGERNGEPLLRNRDAEAEVVGRIGEGEVVRVSRKTLHESNRIAAVNHRSRSSSQYIRVVANRCETLRG